MLWNVAARKISEPPWGIPFHLTSPACLELVITQMMDGFGFFHYVLVKFVHLFKSKGWLSVYVDFQIK